MSLVTRDPVATEVPPSLKTWFGAVRPNLRIRADANLTGVPWAGLLTAAINVFP
jgi:hypothetical protein